jgi:ATP-GRASP peptide maturase of grasp-with-spasm system
MILIFSNRQEPTTDNVIDWLSAHGSSYYRINSEDLLDTSIEKNILIQADGKQHIQIGDFILNPDEITVVWYRRWYAYTNFKVSYNQNINNANLYKYVTDEMNTVFYFITLLLQDKIWLNHPLVAHSHNKLFTLLQAKKVGLLIPDTFVGNTVDGIDDFLNLIQEDAITKPIADPYIFAQENLIYKMFSEKIDAQHFKENSHSFGPSLFQKRIVRDHEIRTFYLDGAFFSTAICSDNKYIDIKLSVSGGDSSSMVNMMPYQLPIDIEIKLDKLMKQLNLNSGSIDIIKDIDGQHYFIEVNPVGQFLGYSFPCNYQLERRVAEWLMEKSRAYKIVPVENQLIEELY